MKQVVRAAVIGAALCAGASASAQQSENARWYAIADGAGAMLGHASSETLESNGARTFVDTQSVYLQEQGARPARVVARMVTQEDVAGRVVSMAETTQAGRFTARVEAHFSGDSAEIVRETPGGQWRNTISLPPNVRFDDGEALLRAWDPATQPRLEFETFNLDAMAVERVVVEAGPRDEQGRITALRTRYDGADLRGVARITLDADMRTVEVAQPMFGATITSRRTDRETALRRHAPYRIIPNMSTPAPYRISATAAQAHIRYRFGFADGFTFMLPQTAEQRVRSADGVLTIDVCADCGPELATDAQSLAAALRPTAWMQSDSPRIQGIVAQIAAMDVSDARKMELLLERAKPYLARFDFNGHYSALDTVQRRAGDCTEAAVLLAAFGRAAGIPARVASGIVYTRQPYLGVSNAFLPHSWTLAYVDGHWRSYDLALEAFDNTHIALTVGDGDARSIAAAGQLASLLRLDAMAEVRTRS